MGRLSDVHKQAFDVAVIGGGIVGCGIARDASLRGLRVIVVEQHDFGSGTTSASTRIIHGGLRYLEMLDFRLVRLDLREREVLLRIAPHLIRPLEFFIPFLSGSRTLPLKMWAGLTLYDALSFDKTLPRRRWLSTAEAGRSEPALQRADVRGVAAYHDARIDSPERLALENIIDAEAHGARAFNYCKTISLNLEHGRVTGIRVRDMLEGAEVNIKSRVVVNATGAWLDLVNEVLTDRDTNALRTTKGIHIVCPPVTQHALVLFSRVDRRLLFAIPRGGLTWIGTTDTDYSGDPADARATREDVQYLLDSVRDVFPHLTLRDVLYTTAGVRALVRRRGTESSVSRMHRIVDGEPLAPPGMISVLGGKITGYRAIAEDVTDAVCRRLNATDRRSTTAAVPLPGATGIESQITDIGDSARVMSHLRDLYGVRAANVLALTRSNADFNRQLSPKYPDIAAQVVYGVRYEHCQKLSDFLRRRTLLGASADQGLDAAEAAAAVMGGELGWSAQRVADEVAAYEAEVAATNSFRR